MKKRSIISWIIEFMGEKKSCFLLSIILAIIGVAASFVPYLLIADIVKNLLAANHEAAYYVTMVAWMGICWILRVFLHSVSTSLSYVGTFHVLKDLRLRLTKKLTSIPLGSVLDSSSGSYKNIIVERIDAMEKTLAHIVPEFSANLLLPIVMFIYLLTLDWRLGLANLISVVIGLCFAAVMMFKSQGLFEVAIEKTKHLNDTTVEYINGIEVIKAFSKTGASYEKFVKAAREGADCFIEWMRRSSSWMRRQPMSIRRMKKN